MCSFKLNFLGNLTGFSYSMSLQLSDQYQGVYVKSLGCSVKIFIISEPFTPTPFYFVILMIIRIQQCLNFRYSVSKSQFHFNSIYSLCWQSLLHLIYFSKKKPTVAIQSVKCFTFHIHEIKKPLHQFST